MASFVCLAGAAARALLTGILAASAASFYSAQARAQDAVPPRGGGNAEVRRVLVVPINLPGRTPVAVDRSQIVQALYGAEDSVASRYRALSYGQLEFAGFASDVADPLPLPEPADFCHSGLKRLAVDAEDALRRRGARLGDYRHFVFVVPKDVPCWWVGLGDIGGNRVWAKATTTKALQHELGHNLGMDHAVHWRSSDAEGSDLMGSGGFGLNAPHVVEMGWLAKFPGKVIELNAAAEVTLEALEADPRQSGLPKVAIVRPAAGGNTYYLSYRSAGQSANPLSAEFTRGVNIHIFNSSGAVGGRTYFVGSLSDGADYADGPMIVRQIAHVDGATVTIRLNFFGRGEMMAAGVPPPPPGTVQSLASGKCLDLPQGKTGDGTPAIQYDCHGGTNQQWAIESAGEGGFHIVSRLSGKCIGTDPAGVAMGGQIVQSLCRAAPEQLWARESAGNGYLLKNAANHLCLDVPGASAANGVTPIAWTCNGGVNQIWRYTSATTP
jgi:hypothetical protein